MFFCFRRKEEEKRAVGAVGSSSLFVRVSKMAKKSYQKTLLAVEPPPPTLRGGPPTYRFYEFRDLVWVTITFKTTVASDPALLASRTSHRSAGLADRGCADLHDAAAA